MAYPTSTAVPFVEPVKQEIKWKTLITPFDQGEENRRQKWLFPKRDLTLKYNYLTKAQMNILWAYYLSMKGAYTAFNFFLPYSDTYVKEYVGTGDASTTVFNLPAKTSSSYTLYVDDVAKTAGGVDWTFASAGGTDGADKATFNSAPAAGAYITFSFTGFLKVRCRFEDTFDYDTFTTYLMGTGVKLKGLLNA
jgi:hypothetical protein